MASLCASTTHAQVFAFPEAEGFGRFTTGARTNLAAAQLYHVTNLNDSGPGSFRDAVSQSNRFVVFDVGGIINLDSVVTVASNITIAGQTAPGGITLYDDRISFTNSHNLISRHFAVRKGSSSGRTDTASIARGQNMIFDHMSITWGVDANFDINPDSGFVIDNITIQNSIIGQGLDNVGHSTGGLMQPGNGGSVSVIKSLYTDNVTRNPKVRYENEFINNVVYGWESAAYIMGDTVNADSHANVEGNYFIEGPIDGSGPFNSGTSNFHIYANDNWVDTDRDGVLDGSLVTSYPGADVVGTRHAFPTNASLTAQQTVAHVMQHAGPSIVRDAVDTRMVQEVASYGTLGGVIERESDLFPDFGTSPIYLNPRARLVDGDNDGMADNWEASKGLNPSNGADWKQLSPTGYTRLEEYVNELGANGNTINSTGGAWTSPGTWSSSSPTLADDAIISGSVTHSSGHGFARRLTTSGILTVTGGTIDVFDTATFNSPSSIAAGALTAGRVILGSQGQTGSLAVQNGAFLQSGTVASEGTGSLMFNGGTFRATGVPDILVVTTLGISGGTIDTAGFNGTVSGPLSGSGGLTKQGEGELWITGPSNYNGPTDIQNGSLRVQTSAALQNSSNISLAAGSQLNASGIAGGGYVMSAGQTVEGAGEIQGHLQSTPGSVVRPLGGGFLVDAYAVGVQAENLALSSDWALFNNAVHGTGNGGSYNGGDLIGGGIIHVNNESLTPPLASGLVATAVDIPEAGSWYLFARVAAPSVSVAPNEVSLGPRGNNSLWVSGNSASVQTTTTNFEVVQSPAGDVADAAVWVQLSPTLPPLAGVWGPEDGGIDYQLAAGLQTFAFAGREVGTILDGFVLASANLTSLELDAALQGTSVFGSSTGMFVTGNFVQNAGATLEIQLSESSQNSLQVGGTANLAGDLTVELLGGFVPEASEEFTILEAGSLVGQFDNAGSGVRLPTADRAGSFAVEYDYNDDTVHLSDYAVAIPGDFNFDLTVDANDLAWWESTYGNLAVGTNFLLWQQHFAVGNVGRTTSSSGAVPEPSSVLLGALASVLIGSRLNRKPDCLGFDTCMAAGSPSRE